MRGDHDGIPTKTHRHRRCRRHAIGDAFCHFYDSKQDLLDTLVPYFKAGLDDKEFCVWVIADPLTKDEAWNALRLAVRDLDRHLADQSIEVFADEEWYLKNNTFDLQR